MENKSQKQKVVFTGGGSGGHVFPNKPLIDHYLDQYEVIYIGSKGGMEEKLVVDWGVRYIPIIAGKLRRYMSLQNALDIFKVFLGIFQCIYILDREKPVFVFSKGGFVSVPVAIAAKVLSITVFVHEADMTPGLANKIASRFATHIFLTFPPQSVSSRKYTVSGLPLRPQIYTADKNRGRAFLGLEVNTKPILLVLGGSLGATPVNSLIVRNLDKLTEVFSIVHIAGKGKTDAGLSHADYKQYEFLGTEIYDVIAASDVVVSRAGANSVIELMTLEKPTLLVPLTLSQSRGDQIENAKYFESIGACAVLHEELLTDEIFIKMVNAVYRDSGKYIEKIKELALPRAENIIIEKIGEYIKK